MIFEAKLQIDIKSYSTKEVSGTEPSDDPVFQCEKVLLGKA
jgi:hypothetical protein